MKSKIPDYARKIRKPTPPPGKFHSTVKGKSGYNRKDNKKVIKEAKDGVKQP